MTKKKKILIVEDEEIILSALTDKFEYEGFEVITAANGEDGLNMAKKEIPDLILLDVIMPVMDGMTTLTKLKEDEDCKNVPVIILTNLSDKEKVAESLKKGAFDYLVKNEWSLGDIVLKVKDKLKMK